MANKISDKVKGYIFTTFFSISERAYFDKGSHFENVCPKRNVFDLFGAHSSLQILTLSGKGDKQKTTELLYPVLLSIFCLHGSIDC